MVLILLVDAKRFLQEIQRRRASNTFDQIEWYVEPDSETVVMLICADNCVFKYESDSIPETLKMYIKPEGQILGYDNTQIKVEVDRGKLPKDFNLLVNDKGDIDDIWG